MYAIHPSSRLNELFAAKPYQGVAPEAATFLFVGLDANYAADIADKPIFDRVFEYHDDGVGFWRRHGVHHPFLLPEYRGDGQTYHRKFARIGFKPEHADMVSFVELLHVPTVGQSKLVDSDLSRPHLNWLNDSIMDGRAAHIFIPDGVARKMIATRLFPWLSSQPTRQMPQHRVLWQVLGKTVYSPMHFSAWGQAGRKTAEAAFIGTLLEGHYRDY